MKALIILVLLATLSFGASLDYRIQHLNKCQTEILVKTYFQAELYNLGYVMAAIAWLESDFGERLEGPTNDFGVFQVILPTFKGMYYPKKTSNPYFDEEIGEMLKVDYQLNFTAAIDVIKFWLKVHKGDLCLALGGYNGGYNGSLEYAKEILKRVEIIKKHKEILWHK